MDRGASRISKTLSKCPAFAMVFPFSNWLMNLMDTLARAATSSCDRRLCSRILFIALPNSLSVRTLIGRVNTIGSNALVPFDYPDR